MCTNKSYTYLHSRFCFTAAAAEAAEYSGVEKLPPPLWAVLPVMLVPVPMVCSLSD